MQITIESEALDSLKAMAQRLQNELEAAKTHAEYQRATLAAWVKELQEERDVLLEALSISQEILESVDPYVGQEDILAEAVVMNRQLIAKCTAEVQP